MKRSVILAVLVAGLLGGCAAPSQMRSEVTRFHQMSTPGGSVAIVAADERKSGGIEFSNYARFTESRLSAAGFRPASGTEPDYVAQLDYWQQPVDGAYDDSGPRVSFGIGGASFGRHSSVGVGVGTSFDLNDRNHRGHIALRTVTLVIERRADGTRVFEGRAQSMGPAGNFPGAVSAMIDAIFTNFPGESGKTITVDATVVPSDSRQGL